MNAAASSARGRQAGIWLVGFALGGFFDGILLHQVLQWHHLLSGLEGATFGELRVQVLADGVFHLLMYIVALVGLVLIWRTARATAALPASRVLALVLLGSGCWHLADALLSHWLLGLHRIRMDVPNPLAWDLLWLAVFGLVPLALGWLLYRRRDQDRGGGSAVAALTILVLLGGYQAALPPRDAPAHLVILRPGADANVLLDGLGEVGGSLLWADPSGMIWAVKTASTGSAAGLYGHGALLVTASPAALGCLAFTRGISASTRR